MYSKLISRRLDFDHDYEEICKWWKWWDWPEMPKVALPEGIMISDLETNTNICAGFLYRTDSCIAWMEFIISNPHVKDKKMRGSAQNLLIDAITQRAREAGFKSVFTSVKNPHLIKRLGEMGYQSTDNNMTNMVMSF